MLKQFRLDHRSVFMLFVTATICEIGFPQALFPSIKELEAQRELAQVKLRSATVQLRDLVVTSCQTGVNKDCDRAAVIDAELMLMDMATKYRRAAIAATSEANIARFSRIEKAADEARARVDDLADLLDE